MTFPELFKKHLTAKPAAYGQVYDTILTPPARVLELGVKAGGSLLVWAERWPDAEVYGIDITMALVRPEVSTHPRVSLMTRDATLCPDDAAPALPLFDLIVDDASHELVDQIKVLENYFPFLAAGGTYVVEDILTDEGADAVIAAGLRLGLVRSEFYNFEGGLDYRVVTLRRAQ